MVVPLSGVRAVLVFRVAIALIAGSLAFLAGKVWLAAHWAASWDPDRVLRAAYLEPSNADYWDRLGLYEKWNFERRDLRRAVVYDQRATEANARSDVYWMDLADAYEAIGQTARARDAFQRAQSVHPISSEVAWRYGNFLLRQKEYSQAFPEIRRALATDPNLTVEAISECSKVSNDLPRVLSEVLPDQNAYYLMAFNYFLTQHQSDAALTVWDQELALKQAVQMPQVVPLVNELIVEQRIDDALRVWRQALIATNWTKDEGDGGASVVFNGGFEREPLNGAFDWREDSVSGATLSSDSDVVHGGKHALRISFDGSANLDFQNLWQICPVQPGHRYHFAAFLRLEEISTDSGIRFTIYDTFHPPALQILTSDLVGTRSWSPVEADFVAGPETRAVTIALRRLPSWKFDNKLHGTVWVDDVSLVPAVTPRQDRAR